jgi:hypothetical protein
MKRIFRGLNDILVDEQFAGWIWQYLPEFPTQTEVDYQNPIVPGLVTRLYFRPVEGLQGIVDVFARVYYLGDPPPAFEESGLLTTVIYQPARRAAPNPDAEEVAPVDPDDRLNPS